MIRRGAFGRDENEKQMRRTAIQRIEIDTLRAARKDTVYPLQVRQFAVRYGNPFTDGGGTDSFALHEHAQHPLWVEIGIVRGEPSGQLFQNGILFSLCKRRY